MKTAPHEPIHGRPKIETQGITIPAAHGLTKREYFAGLAMQGLLTNEPKRLIYHVAIARDAAKYADALIEALNAEHAKPPAETSYIQGSDFEQTNDTK